MAHMPLPSEYLSPLLQTNEDTIVRFSATGRTVLLVSEEFKFIWIFAGITPSEVVRMKHPLLLLKI